MSEPDAQAVDEVLKVEQRWVEAHRELDVGTIRDILAEDYLQIRADGSVIGKPEAVRSYQSGRRRWDKAESTDHRVTIHGDVAILVGRWRGRGENHGERFDYSARFMAVYVRRDGLWKLVADQSTRLSS